MARLLILINDVPYFLLHRLAVAQAAHAAGWEVEVAAPGHESAAALADHGIAFHPLALVRGRAAPVSDLAYMRDVARLVTCRRPDLVHAITIKPVALGGLALRHQARRTGRPSPLVATIPGLGSVFDRTRPRRGRALARSGVEWLYRAALRHRPLTVTFETESDRDVFTERLGLVPERAVVVPGAGVDLDAFAPGQRADGRLRVLFAGRFLHAKGIADFAAAAGLTAGRDDICWMVAGWRDPGNPDSLTAAEERSLSKGRLRHLGRIEDMADLLKDVDVVALPSRYPEGIPRILIEAAAAGAVPMASDFPGARTVIADGETGILLQPPLARSLAESACALADDPARRARLAAAARRHVAAGGFDTASVTRRFLDTFATTAAEAADAGGAE